MSNLTRSEGSSEGSGLGALEKRTATVWQVGRAAAIAAIVLVAAAAMLAHASYEAAPIAEIAALHVPSAVEPAVSYQDLSPAESMLRNLVSSVLDIMRSTVVTAVLVLLFVLAFAASVRDRNPAALIPAFVILSTIYLVPTTFEMMLDDGGRGSPNTSSQSLESSDWERAYVSAQSWHQAGAQAKVKVAVEKMLASPATGEPNPAHLYLLEQSAFGAPRSPAAVDYVDQSTAASAVRRSWSTVLFGLGAVSGVLGAALVAICARMRRRVALLTPQSLATTSRTLEQDLGQAEPAPSSKYVAPATHP